MGVEASGLQQPGVPSGGGFVLHLVRCHHGRTGNLHLLSPPVHLPPSQNKSLMKKMGGAALSPSGSRPGWMGGLMSGSGNRQGATAVLCLLPPVACTVPLMLRPISSGGLLSACPSSLRLGRASQSPPFVRRFLSLQTQNWPSWGWFICYLTKHIRKVAYN